VELRQLEYFVRVAEAGTYLAAARASRIAQPALWRHVKELERELGTELFERAGRNVRLTRQGQVLLEEARGALMAASRLTLAADDLRHGRAGALGIACAAPHLRAFVADAIAELRSARPGIRIDIREYGAGAGPGPGILQDLQHGIVDFATGEYPGGDPRLASIPLYPTRLVAAVPANHPWARKRRIEVTKLRDQPLVCGQRGSFSRRTLEAACARAGFIPEIAFDSHSPVSIVALGEAGLGIPIMVEDAVSPPARRTWPVVLHRGKPLGAMLCLVWRKESKLSPAASAFKDIAQRIARARRP
jgi:DNA-binding transcriptional LysR family regulator